MMLTLKVPSARARREQPGPALTKGEGVRIAAVRRRDRMRLLTGLMVMAVCALLFGVLAVATGHRSQVLALAKPVAAGQVLTGADVKSVLVSAEEGLTMISAGRRDAVVGQKVNSALPAGLLLSEDLLGQGPTPPGSAVVTLALKEGRYPPTLGAGERVSVYETRPAATVGGAGAGPAGAEPVTAMTLDVRPGGGSSGGAVVMLQVTVGQAGRLVADQEPAVVLLGADPVGSAR
ncbi:hypothetical protein [Kitasatospora sp. MAP5-34]|uniref:hypothetical protein n=1 Tax=Kitasatospora sp. MAP5-34 TaxID=3035102 RepID=UPI0024733ED3|nr:hypothetical protein [Kitasatospora sp. MAP5-34]MDH6579404.1 hypothetical protein [Kitasatospora sp. MAP5-34]